MFNGKDVFYKMSEPNLGAVSKIRLVGKSLTYKRKRRGPSILPCGTPDSTGRQEEEVPMMQT